MEDAFPCILLLLSWATASSKYVHIDDRKTWFEACQYCREQHTDLAHVSNEKDNQRLQEKKSDHSWFGLYRDSRYSGKWRWSGGGEVSEFTWGRNQPESRSEEDYGTLYDDGWHDNRPEYKSTFLCYNPIVVRERKTWEEAIEYCRQHHQDLASLLSETEMMLISKALLQSDIREHVWIGLHFFSGKWLWVDGESTAYKAWGGQGEPACPNPMQVCAALRMKTDANPANVSAASGCAEPAAAAVPGEWEARNCDDSLPFICY